VNHLEQIIERKRREVSRRKAHARGAGAGRAERSDDAPARRAVAALRRDGAALPRVISEIKLRSPSAGVIRARRAGSVQSIARGYAEAGAAAVSVLCDGPGFGGSVLDLRRAGGVVSVPLLFKEFVVDPLQVDLARELGASMVLLIVRALDAAQLRELVDCVLARGMAPVVEAADDDELEAALGTRADVVGVNARDLRSFRVDPGRARGLIARIPAGRVAVHMSGIASAADLRALGATRADAALVGEALMRAPDPGARLREWLGQR
jgi:indole-3-glycerol phosphate synthase